MKRVLLLDDDRDLCSVMVQVFESLGVTNYICLDSYKTLIQLKSLDYDIAIIDINLGIDVPNGYDAYDWLIDHEFKGKIAFFSGHAPSSSVVKRALEIPGAIFIAKPVELNEIEKILL